MRITEDIDGAHWDRFDAIYILNIIIHELVYNLIAMILPQR